MIDSMKNLCDIRCLSFVWVVGLLLLGGQLPELAAQQIVYEMEFERERGFNDRDFVGGFFVAPVVGGQGSLVLTSRRGNALEVQVIGDGAKLFRAVTEKKEVRWVVQAQVGGGAPTNPNPPPDGEDDDDGGDDADSGETPPPAASTGAFLAIGKGNQSATFRTPLIVIDSLIARELKGEVISASSAALDEEFEDVGFVAMSNWRLKWAERETNEVNRQGLDLAQASAYLVGLLERGGGGGGGPPIVIPPPLINTTSLSLAEAGVAYTQALSAIRGVPPYTFAVTGLPTGLTLSGSTISGTTPTNGRFSVRVTVSDSQTPPQTSSVALSLTVLPSIRPDRTTLPTGASGLVLAEGKVGTAYTPVTFSAVGAVGSVTFTEAWQPAAPAGMTFTSGVLSGTPSAAGIFTLAVTVRDGTTNLENTTFYQLTVAP
jgi:hypothetical protein